MTNAAATAERQALLRRQSHSRALRPKMRGGLLLPTDEGYDDARSIWNAMIDRRPALIARCLGVADVRAVRQLRARARPAAVDQGRRPQHRRAGGAATAA